MYHIIRGPMDVYILVREVKRTPKRLAGHRYWESTKLWGTTEDRYHPTQIIASFADEARALAAYQALWQLVYRQDAEAVTLRQRHRDEITALLEAHKE